MPETAYVRGRGRAGTQGSVVPTVFTGLGSGVGLSSTILVRAVLERFADLWGMTPATLTTVFPNVKLFRASPIPSAFSAAAMAYEAQLRRLDTQYREAFAAVEGVGDIASDSDRKLISSFLTYIDSLPIPTKDE